MAKKKKIDFLNPSASTNTRGKKINWLKDGQPNEDLNIDMFDSFPMFDESDSKANQDTGGAEFKDEVGLVAITTDVKAKANISGLEADRTLVVHAGQLPTVVATDVQGITGTDAFSGVVLDVSADATTTRNNFLIKLSSAFLTWFQALKDLVYTNQANIATNITNIATNVTNIATNTTNIATNTTDIATNVTNIATNVTNIATNVTNIATNVTNIATNTADIATNTADIATNTADIATIDARVTVNEDSISSLSSAVTALQTYTTYQFNIGDWNMDATDFVDVAHGLSATEYKTISNVFVLIRDDADTVYHNLFSVDPSGTSATTMGSTSSINATNIRLIRTSAGFFDGNTDFDSTSYNRGFINITYIAD